MSYINQHDCDVVIIVDADCLLERGARDLLAQTAIQQQKPDTSTFI